MLHRPSLFAALALALAGCPRPQSAAPAADPAVRSGDRTPELAEGFQPGAPLADPPAPDPLQPGLDYLRTIAAHVQPAWASFLETARLRLPPTHPLNRADAVAVLEIVLEPGGELAAVRVAEPSGVPELDQAALEIVEAGAPYGEPPPLWISDDDRVHVRWRFARDRRQAGVAGARLVRLSLPIAEAVPRLLEAGRIELAAGRIAREAEDRDAAALAPLVDQVALAALAQDMRAGDSDGAAAAIDAAAAARAAELAPALRRIASDSVAPAPRRAALRALGQLGDREAVELLQAAALGADPAAATEALVRLDAAQPVVDRAVAELGSEDGERRARALAILGAAPAPAAAPALAAIVGGDSQPRADRRAAAAALAASAGASKRALHALIGCLERGDAGLQAACAEALAAAAAGGLRSRFGYWKVLALRRHADERVRAAGLRAAAGLDPARFGRDLGPRADPSALVAEAVAASLGPVPGPKALDRLLELAGADEPAVREAAARSLARRKEPRARAALAALLADPAPAVRAAAMPAAGAGDLAPHLADPAPAVQAAAFARLVTLRGRDASVAEAAARLSQASAGSGRALIAAAWLASR